MTAALARETALPGPGRPAPFLHPWFELAKVGHSGWRPPPSAW